MSENKLVQLLNQYNHEHTVTETGASLKISPITTGQMKAILQYEGDENPNTVEKVLDDIIEGCVITRPFSVDDLTLQDRFDLLIGIRMVSKGDNYKFNIKCPKCKQESMQFVDLSTLEVTPFKADRVSEVKINDNLTVNLDFVRRGHQKQSEELVDKMVGLSPLQSRSEIATYMYAFGMTGFSTPEGKLEDISVEEKKEFLDALSASAYEVINGWYEENDYGIRFKYTIKCQATGCDFEQEEDIPISGFFF